MSNLVADNIINALGDKLISLYHYLKWPEDIIPVFILKEMDFSSFDGIKWDLEDKHFIVLTQDDIMRGNDIFPLKFLHMQHNSTLQRWVDILPSLIIEKKYLRATIEFELRNKLIQLRESYLSFKGKKEFVQQILPVMLMIWDGILYLDWAHASPSYPELKKQIKNFASNSEEIFDAITKPWDITDEQVTPLIQKISTYLESLTHHVDTLHI